jgi:uncharacterized membrane protein
MNRKSMGLVSLVLVIAMVAIAVWVAGQVPDAARLPIHWDYNGHPNGFAGKWTALLLPAGMSGALSLLFYFLPAIEPRRENLQRSQGLVFAAWAGLLIVMLLIDLTVVAGALHWALSVQAVMLVGVGLMFAAIGNQLGKSRSMFLVGIRTPWTLSSEEVWIKTNRLGGKLMMAAGLVMMVTAFAPLPGRAVPSLVIGLVVVMVGVPIVYSYLLWRRERGAGQVSG